MKIKRRLHKLFGITPEHVMLKEIKNKKTYASYGPEYVVIDITNKCNLNCVGCWTYSPLIKKSRPDNSWFKKELPYEKIIELVEDLDELKTKEIRLTGGGEPFLHPKILDIIELIKNKKIKLDITTNFTLVNKEKIDILIKNNVDNITISLWAASPETYVKTHPNQSKKTFGKIIRNLNYLSKNRRNSKIVIANVISRINYMEIEKMIDLAYRNNVEEVYFTLIDPIKEQTDKLLLTKKMQKKLMQDFKKIIKNYKRKYYGKLIIDNPENFLSRIESDEINKGNYDKNLIYDFPCTAGWTFSRIMADGSIAPCCKAVMFPTGNLYDARFIEIWNSYKQTYFRKIGLNLKKHPKFVDKVGCEKTCDNLAQNQNTFQRLRKIK